VSCCVFKEVKGDAGDSFIAPETYSAKLYEQEPRSLTQIVVSLPVPFPIAVYNSCLKITLIIVTVIVIPILRVTWVVRNQVKLICLFIVKIHVVVSRSDARTPAHQRGTLGSGTVRGQLRNTSLS